jgi:hypothetical protein
MPMDSKAAIGPQAVKRFWANTRKSDEGCWAWAGSVQPRGYPYGRLSVYKRTALAHRVSWILHFGSIPAGLCVLHRCDNPRCVRPDHLFLGTQKDNTADAIAKGRKAYPRPHVGENQHQAKLTAAAARAIFQRAAKGENQRAIAAAYGINQSVVSKILTGRAWRAATATVRK